MDKIHYQLRNQSELIDSVSDAIISTDLDFKIKSWNKAAENIYGYSAKQAIGKSMQNLVDVEYINEDRKKVLDQFIKKGYWKGETLQKRKNGKLLNIYSSVNCIKDDNGDFLGAVAVNRDITDQKRIENQIVVANERLQYLLSSTQAVIYSAKAFGDFGATFISNNVDKVTGYKPSDFLNNSSFWLDHIHPDDKKHILDHLSKIFKKKTLKYEYRFRKRDGSYIWFLDEMKLVEDKNGDPIEINGFWLDVTDRKKAEDALRKAKSTLELKIKERTAELEETNEQLIKENQKRLQALKSLELEQARLDALFRLSQISETSLDKITNVTLEQAISLTQSKIGFIGLLNEDETVYTLHSVSKNVIKDCKVVGNPIHWPVANAGIWADAIRNHKTLIVNDYSKPHPHKKGIPKGHLHLKKFMVVPIFENKKIKAVAGVANKISNYNKSDERQIFLLLSGMWSYIQKNRSREELQKAHYELEDKVKQRTAELESSTKALQESEERYRLAQRAADIGSWDWDIISDDLEWSETIEPMFGFKKGEFGKTYEAFLDCIHPDDRQFVIDSVNTCLEKNKQYDIEHRIIWLDGTIHWVRETGDAILDKDGKPVRMIGIVQEITDRKKNEEQIKKLNESLWEYTVRLKAANNEVEAFSYSVSHDLRAPLRSIDGFSQALIEDYADTLDETGIDYLKRLRNASQRMGQLIDGMLQLSRLSRKKMHVEKVNMAELAVDIIDKFRKEDSSRNVDFRVQDDLVIKGDKNFLQILLENLLGNAWKFTSKRSKAKIEFGKTKKKNEIVFFIKDNGAGFDVKYIDKLFVPFQRLHDDEFPGYGIGLGIVSRIIRRHGGQIWADGEVGKGAIFYFTLGGKKYD